MPQPPPVPRAAEPRFGRNFDPWNSVGAGHQRAETKGPGGWQESRALKMNSQFRAGHSGGARLSDTVGAGAEHFDERLGAIVTPAVKARAKTNVMDMLRRPGSMKESLKAPGGKVDAERIDGTQRDHEQDTQPRKELGGGFLDEAEEYNEKEVTRHEKETSREPDTDPTKRKILEGVTVYVNGSTHPLVSDHRLKHLLAEHGARVALHLPRRQVTHVILGRPAGGNGGAGGGLAGGKLEREIRRVGGKGIRFVGVEWVLESIKAGRRLPEARFTNLTVAPRAQRCVMGLFPSRDRQAPGPT